MFAYQGYYGLEGAYGWVIVITENYQIMTAHPLDRFPHPDAYAAYKNTPDGGNHNYWKIWPTYGQVEP